MRRLISILLVICLMPGISAQTIAATVSVVTDKETVAAGEDVTVTLWVDETMNDLVSFEYWISYDQTLFQMKRFENGNANLATTVSDTPEIEQGTAYYKISAIDPKSEGMTVEKGRLCSMVFTVSTDLKADQLRCFSLIDRGVYRIEDPFVPMDNTAGTSVSVLLQTTNQEKGERGDEMGRSKWFSDVHGAGHWAREAVDYVTEKGLFGGMSPTTFAPNTPMNRAMLMTVLARMDGQNTDGGSIWYEKGMQWAVDSGISDGTNPLGNITREQMAAMLYRYSGNPDCDGELTVFPDYRGISTYAVNAMKWAVAEGLIHGMNGKLEPQGSATRAQVATILMRYMDLH